MHKPPLILVVDDAPADALLLSRSLSKSGYALLTANNGPDAVRVALESRPDLILLDMTMPGMDGIATCGELKNDAATDQIPVIFVTAHADSAYVVKAFAVGGSDYVTKPVRIAELLARLSVHLRLREAEHDLVQRNGQLESLAGQLSEMNEALARQSRIDGLTNLFNRRAWDEAAQIEHERATRYSHPYCVLMMDVDCFKAYNDSLGHPAGDRCLQQVAGAVAQTCRNTDLVGRYGGEEFVVLAPESTVEAGVRLAERIRSSVWSLSLRHPGSPAGRVTVSIGVAESCEGSLADVLRSADTFLYRAKSGGRNLVSGRGAASVGNGVVGDPRPTPLSHEITTAECERASTILVVEDNRPNRVVFRGCLEKEGYRIREAEDGAAALAAVAEHKPDLILMDVMMPVMDGLECTRRLKADPEARDIPIIIVSARDDSGSVLAGLDAGAEEYLTKPIRSTELVARVRSMVRLTHERRDLLRSYGLRAEQILFLTALVEFCRSIGQSETSDEILDRTIETVAEITCSQRVSVMLPDSDQKHLTIARSIGIDEKIAGEVIVPIGKGVAGRVFATRKAIVMNTAEADQGEAPITESEPYVSIPLLATPLGTSTHILGVLNVTKRVGNRPFDGRELEYVDLIAGIAASALRTIRNRQARDVARDMIVNALARLAEHRDSDTGCHVERVTQYSCILAKRLLDSGRFSRVIGESFIGLLAKAVPLHDIGKVAIPDRILLKPGRLSLEEMEVMRTHVDIGADTLRPIIAQVPDADSLKMALDIIRAHHEWYDGCGYPRGLKGDEIPLSARIVAVADVYDALTRDRVYKKAIPYREAENIIVSASGTQFDPMVVEAFVESKDELRTAALRLKPASGCSPPGPVAEPLQTGLDMQTANR